VTTLSYCARNAVAQPTKRLASMLVVSWLVSAGATADEPTYLAWIKDADLVNKCNGDRAWQQAYCVGYIVGVADVINNDRSGAICVPKAITQAQMKAVVVKYLARHEYDSDYAAFSSVRAALQDAFPCRPRRTM
jgi:hypothetical protein